MREHVRGADGPAFINKFVTLIRSVISGSHELPAENEEGLLFPTIPLSGWAGVGDLTTTSMSDSIVISLSHMHGFQPLTCGVVWPIYIVMEYVFWLQRALIQLGILTRGAITIADLHHSQDIVAGEGLIEAYELESSLAIFPRVILSESIVNWLLEGVIPPAFVMKDRIASLFKQDLDGLYFIDYLGLSALEIEADWKERLTRIEQLTDGLLSTTISARVRQKLAWLKSYISESTDLADELDSPRPHTRTGRLEDRFPRYSGVE
jgi:hypothetical protein